MAILFGHPRQPLSEGADERQLFNGYLTFCQALPYFRPAPDMEWDNVTPEADRAPSKGPPFGTTARVSGTSRRGVPHPGEIRGGACEEREGDDLRDGI